MDLTLFSREPKNEFSLQGKLGLVNYGNSSFVNAIIQALSNIEQICFMIRTAPIDYIRSVGGVEDQTERKNRSDIVLALRKVLCEMWTDKRVVITPAVLIRRMNQIPVLKEAILNTSIEDTYIYLMEVLHESFQQIVPPHFEPKVNLSDSGPVWMMKRSGSEYAYQRSLVSDAVQGVTMLTSTCSKCGKKEETMDPLLFLKIDMVRITGQGHLNSGGFREDNNPALSSFTKKSSRKVMRSKEPGKIGQAIHWMRALSLIRIDSLGPSKKQQSMGSEEDFVLRGSASEGGGRSASVPLSEKLRQLSYSFVTRFRQSDVQTSTPDNSNRVAVPAEVDTHTPVEVIEPSLKQGIENCTGAMSQENSNLKIIRVTSEKLSCDEHDRSPSTSAILPPDPLDVTPFARSKSHPETSFRAPPESKECDGGDHTASSDGSIDGISVAAGDTSSGQTSTESRDKRRSQRKKVIKRTPSNPSTGDDTEEDDKDITRASSGSVNSSFATNSARADCTELNNEVSKYEANLVDGKSTNTMLLTPSNCDDIPSYPVPSEPMPSLSLRTICTLDTDADILNSNTTSSAAARPFRKEVLREGTIEPTPNELLKQEHEYIRVDESLTEEEDERSAIIPFRKRRNSSIRMQLSKMSPREEQDAAKKESSESQTMPMSTTGSSILDDGSFTTFMKNLPRTVGQLAHAAKIEFGIRGLGSTVSLTDCLKQNFASRSSLEYCPCCGEDCEMKKTMHIATAPEVLVIYFNRFVNMGFHHSKINSKIDFPINDFDLRDHLDSSSGYFQSSWQQNPVYDLAVVIEHAGTNKFKSQYNTLARHMPEDIWFEYEDHLVKQVSERYVRSREALMLFYVKRGPPKDTTNCKFHPPLEELQRRLKENVVTRWKLVEEERQYLKDLAEQERNKLRRFGIMHVLKYWKKRNVKTPKAFGNAIRRISNFSKKSIASLARRSIVEKNSTSSGRLKPGSKWKVVQVNMRKIARDGKATRMKEIETRQEIRRKSRATIGPLSPRARALNGIKNEIKGSLLGRLAHERGEIEDFDDEEYENALNYVILDTPPKKSQVFISLYWIMRFLSFSDPGPICNDDIACPHGHLKPHLHACKKHVCIPVDIELWKHIEIYLYEQYGYAIHNKDNMDNVPPPNDGKLKSKDLFRPLLDMVPCLECMEKHAALMDRRSNEMERVVVENILDGYEDPLPEETDECIMREVQAELKKREKPVIKLLPCSVKSQSVASVSQCTNDIEVTRRSFALLQEWSK